jgi:predicted regulator of Ras-like GTPase activity (Roadblock/LC7/MglB family)
VSVPDLQRILDDLICSAPESRGAMLLAADGTALAQATSGLPLAAEAISVRCQVLLQETLGVAERLDQGPVADVLLEADRGTLAMIPLRNGGCLCLVLQPGASTGRGLFAARRAAARLNDLL